MAIKAVVFDLFETLVANGPDLWLKSFERIGQAQALAVEPRGLWEPWIRMEREFRRRRLDPVTLRPAEPFESYQEVWTDCFRRAFAALGLPGDAEAAAQICIGDLAQRPLFADTLEVLEGLGGKLRLAVLSNADRSFLEPLLEHHGIRGKFSAVFCSEEARVYKPHPSIFHQLLERLGLEPWEAMQVGDTLGEDVRGAKLVGMQGAWLNRSGVAPDPALPRPDYELRSLEELLPILGRGVQAPAEA